MRRDDPISSLIDLLSRLPGIGQRTAARLAFHVLEGDEQYAQALGQALSTIHGDVTRCELCGNYGAESRCAICLDPRRDASVICVVAKVPDLIALEALGSFRGRYHVLHALLAPLDGVGPDQLPLDALERRIDEEGVNEIIIATPLNVEGEATALYVADSLRTLAVRVSRIAAGVPHGGELEFTDQVTLGRALEDRRSVR
ncbi:MAG: recombination protein RecR [Deltaproteobacteria bacterium]|jgi:recombination protein RecR|nr:recombination protein RecR [Deltaproteobacteria bacterium]